MSGSSVHVPERCTNRMRFWTTASNQYRADRVPQTVQCEGKGHPITSHEDPEVEMRYSSTLSLTSTLDEVGGQRHAPAALPPGKNRYPLYRTLGGPQGRSGRVRKISPATGIRSPDLWTRRNNLVRYISEVAPSPPVFLLTGRWQPTRGELLRNPTSHRWGRETGVAEWGVGTVACGFTNRNRPLPFRENTGQSITKKSPPTMIILGSYNREGGPCTGTLKDEWRRVVETKRLSLWGALWGDPGERASLLQAPEVYAK